MQCRVPTWSSVHALLAVSHSVRSLLGPQRVLKCVADTIADGRVLTSNALRVLDHVALQHPAALLLFEACESLTKAHGCGTTTLACLTAELAAGAAHIEAQGFAMRAVLRGMRQAVRRVVSVLQAIAMPVPRLVSVQAHGLFPCAPTACVIDKDATPSASLSLPSAAARKEHDEEDVSWFFSEDVPHDTPAAEGGTADARRSRRTDEATQRTHSHLERTSTPSLDLSDEVGTAQRAQQLKDRGNEELHHGRMTEALALYSAAIDLIESGGRPTTSLPPAKATLLAVCLSNRSLAHAKAGLTDKALLDAQQAVHVAPTYAKGHHRLGSALRHLGRHEEARGCLATANALTRKHRQAASEDASAPPQGRPERCSAPLGEHRGTASQPLSSTSPSAVDLYALGEACSHGKSSEMALAVECATLLGAPPWTPRQSVHVHRLVGCAPGKSVTLRGVLQPLGLQQRASAEVILRHQMKTLARQEPDSSACSDTAWAVGCSDANFDRLTGFGGWHFAVGAALVDADVQVPRVGGSAAEGEFSVDGVFAGSARIGATNAASTMIACLRRMGVGLLLIRGSMDDEMRRHCEAEGVLALPGVSSQLLRTLCAAANCMPLRDTRALSQMVTTEIVPLEGQLLRAGVLPPEEAVAYRRTLAVSNAESTEDCYLYLQVAAAARPTHECSYAPPVTVLACGRTVDLAKDVEARFWNCMHRLEGALQSDRVLPGAGTAEMACAAALEHDVSVIMQQRAAQSTAASHLPSVTPEPTEIHVRDDMASVLRREVLGCVASSLRQLVRQVMLNCGTQPEKADDVIAASSRRWLSMVDATGLPRTSEMMYSDADWCPLIFPGDSSRGPHSNAIFDHLGAKVAALHASMDVLEQVLLSDALITNR